MRYGKAAAVVAAGVLLIGGATACSSSGGGGGSSSSPSPTQSATPNGVDALSASEILAKTKTAAEGASSVNVKLDAGGSNEVKNFDMTMTTNGAQGTITLSTVGSVQLISDGSTVYIKGDDAFNTSYGGSEGAKLLSGKWLAVPASDSRAQDFKGLGSVKEFFGAIFGEADPKNLSKEPVKDVNGVQCVGLKGEQEGTLWVATVGEPFPMSVTPPTGQPGSITMTNWNAPVTITPPPADEIVDLSKLTGSSGSPSPTSSS